MYIIIKRKGRTSGRSALCLTFIAGTFRSKAQLSEVQKSQEEDSEVLWYKVNHLPTVHVEVALSLFRKASLNKTNLIPLPTAPSSITTFKSYLVMMPNTIKVYSFSGLE